MGALCMGMEDGSKPPMRVLTLEENRLAPQMSAQIQTQLLLNNMVRARARAIERA